MSDGSAASAVSQRFRAAIDRFVSEGLLVRPGEGRRTALLFAQLLLSSAVFTLGRTVRDTLFLSRFSIKALPWMFVLYGVASALTVVAYSRVADKLPRSKMIVSWCALGASTYLGVWIAAKTHLIWIYPVFYVWSEVFANLLISQFWTLANDLHDPRSAKRLFATIGAARVLGVILVGLAAGVIVRAIGTQQLLFVLIAMLALIAALAVRLGNEPRPASAPTRPRKAPRRPKAAPSVLKDQYVRAIAAMFFLTFSALTIGDYQFKAIARETYREDALAQFFSLFYAGAGTISFLFQIIVTPRLLARFGVGLGMTVMPAVFGAASATLLGVPALAVATVMKFADNGFQYTIHESTVQALYGPFAPELKVRTRAFLDAVIKPMAYALGGVALLLFAQPLGKIYLSIVSVALVAGWLAVIPTVRRRYLAQLEKTLHVGRLSEDNERGVDDPLARKVLVNALSNSDPRVVLAALDALGDSADPAVLAAYEKLCAHPDAAVRVAALERLGPFARATKSKSDDVAIERALSDNEPHVRAAAAHAHALARGDDAVDALAPLLDDPDRNVRTRTTAALLSHGGLEGALSAGARVQKLIGSGSSDDRADAASVLGEVGPSGSRRLVKLLEDSDHHVVHAALVAAQTAADPRLIDPLCALLTKAATRREAATALSAIGVAVVAKLSQMLLDEKTDRATRLLIPRILRDVRTIESYQALDRARNDRDSHLRLRVFSALSKLRITLRLPPVSLDDIQALVLREVRESLRLQAAWESVRATVTTPLLEEEMKFREVRSVRRMLRILELRFPPDTMKLVRDRIEDPSRRATAIELLDSSIDPPLRPLVIPFFDDVAIKEKCERLGVKDVPTLEEFSRAQCEHANPYVTTLWLDALDRAKHPLAKSEAERARNCADPMVREAAERVLAEAKDRKTMTYSTIEKLLVLRTASIFERLRAEDLAPLARVAEVEEFAPDEVVFAEGDPGDALYVVAHGHVGISHDGKRLATLQPGDAFGEMAVLDEAPRSAAATALEATTLLRIGSDEFYEVLREQSEIAEGVIRMLSRRLREANETRAQGERSSEVLPSRPPPAK